MHNFKHHFGQNFLKDTEAILDMIETLRPQATDKVLEIGPGQGALTEYLTENVGELRLLEIDKDLIDYLETNFGHRPNVSIVNADVLLDPLDFEFNKVIGALPYNISKQIIKKILLNPEKPVERAVFMLQKEVAFDYAGVGKKGSLLNHLYATNYTIELIGEVEKSKFFPMPKVDSASLIFKRKQSNAVSIPLQDIEEFAKFLRIIFLNPRKKLIKNLTGNFKGIDWDTIYSEMGLLETTRVEELSQEAVILLFKRSRK